MNRSCGTTLLGRLAAALLATCSLTTAYTLDPDSTDSISSTAKSMAADMVSFYSGDKPGGTPGLLPDPYYWWEAGAMMGSLVDYWYYTGDDQYNNLTQQALLFQTGDTNDYMPKNQTRTEGNDDQGFWGFAVMTAAEYNFPNPPPDKPQWLALAQAVFNTQASRWDKQDCGGGLRWQIFPWNNGINYKNSISQACLFALASRLALYTGNNSYADWAEKTWDWMVDVKFIDAKSWYVYDGADIGQNCTDIVPYQWTYNAGGMLLGAAAMYNHTEDPKWKSRLDNLLQGAKVFFTGPQKNIMTEVACEPVNLCNLDQQSFKAYLSRWLANVTKWAPYTYDTIMPYLKASAVAAAKQCVGGANKRMCGLIWNKDKYDGSTGVGQQMAALEVTMALMIKDRPPPVTGHTGGTSQGNPGGGGSDIGRTTPPNPNSGPVGGGEKFGAALITIMALGSVLASFVFLLADETSETTTMRQFQDARSSASLAILTFASGGTAAALASGKAQKGKGNAVNEKAGGVLQTSTTDVAGDEKKASSVVVSHVRRTSEGSSRRLSSMPIGWPQNSSGRVNTGDNTHSRPLSVQDPLSDLTIHTVTEVPSSAVTR